MCSLELTTKRCSKLAQNELKLSNNSYNVLLSPAMKWIGYIILLFFYIIVTMVLSSDSKYDAP